ncbi:MAG: PEP-CTERM sorting domain-containing protein, partial [Verrucomicrobia bacterium]|nr:PEP-CTERM sorting domain-containing protein [Verrucomicrobiota bacterium]
TAAVGSASYATTSNPIFSPAANNLILGLAPWTYSNGAEGGEGTGPISLLTNGATPTGNPDTYYVGDNATITYRLPVSTLGYNLSAINIYSGWNDDGRENITLNNISFSTVGTPLIFTPINGSSVNFEANADTGLARLTSTGGVLVAGVYAVRFNFGNQENGAVGYREIEVVGVPAGAGSNVLPVKTPVVLDSNTTLNLNNVSQQVASLADMDPTPGNTTGHTVVLGGATLTIGDPTNLSTAETIFSGDITSTTLHASAVEKVGPSVQTLNGAQTYDTLTVTAGTLNVNGELGTTPANGTATVDVADHAKLQFGNLSQTLSSLTIGDGATVTFTSGMAFGAFSGGGGKSPAFGGTAAVPEPGSLALLLVGALGVLNRRRREA